MLVKPVSFLFLFYPLASQAACPHSRAFTSVPNDDNHRNLRQRAKQNSRSLNTYTCWTLDAYEKLYDLIETEAEGLTDFGERGHFLGGIVRLAAHDFMDYDIHAINKGGPDGCLDLSDPANAGLSDIWCDDPDSCPYKAFYDSEFSFSSIADFWVAGATAVVKYTSQGALDMPFRHGRKDQETCIESSNRLPEPTGCQEVEDTFITRMGLTWTDAVALMGAHTLGRGHAAFSGHDGTWVANDEGSCIFDKKYFDESIDRGWRPQLDNAAGTNWKWGGNDNTVMMLNTDLCLYFEIDNEDCCTNVNTGSGTCRTFENQCGLADQTRPEAFEAFNTFYDGGSDDNSNFFDAFEISWKRATELGQKDTLQDITHFDNDCVVRTRSDAPNIIIFQPDDLPFFENWTPPSGGISPGSSFDTANLPFMEILRTSGLEMKQAYTASPKCGTSRYSTMTGRYPSRSSQSRIENRGKLISKVTIPTTKLEDVKHEMDCSEDNLAKIFQLNDYRTGFFGKWHLQKFGQPNPDNYEDQVDMIKTCGFDEADGIYMHNLDGYPVGTTHNLEWMTGLAIDFIKETEYYGDKPFFIYFNPTVPHSSADVHDALLHGNCTDTPAGYDAMPNIDGMTAEYYGDGIDGCRAYRQTVIDRVPGATSSDNKELGAIWLDDAIGALYKVLEAEGKLDNTIFLFQIDHGMGAKSELYEGGTRIAQFVHYPDGFGTDGTTFEGMVSTIDIGPTLLDYAGITTLSPGYYEMDGLSWKDAVNDDAVESEWNADRCLLFEYDENRAVRCACEKYLEIGGDQFYYDLCDHEGKYYTYPDADPEEINGFDTNPDRVYILEDVLDCYESKTMPDNPRDFTTDDCKETFATKAPMSAPTSPPTISNCADNPGRFFLDHSDPFSDRRNCEWVGKNMVERCKSYGCSECPVTCQMCDCANRVTS